LDFNWVINFNKTIMKNILSLSLLFVLFLSGCIYYRSAEIAVMTDESVNTIVKYKPLILLGKSMYSEPKKLNNFKVENGVISGEVTNYGGSYRYRGQKSFLRGNFREALSVTHLTTNKELVNGPITLALSDVKGGQVYEKAPGLTALTTVGVTAGATAGGLLVFLIIACNCPHVAVINPDGTENFQGSMFPGSMFKMLERSDKLVLSNLEPNAEGATEIKVYNELEEVQYLDNIQLTGVSHSYGNLGLNEKGELIAFNQGALPVSAKAQNGVDVLQALSARDDVDYNFDEVGIEEELNSVELTFNTKNIGDIAQLVIRGQQSEWLEQTAEYFFQQFGTYFPTWVDKMNDGDADKYNQNAIDQGISMNTYVKQNGEWQYVGSFNNVGTVAKRDITLPIDLSAFGDEVEVKLESAHAFWNVDQVSLTSEWSTELNTTEFSALSAVNELGEDVSATIAAVDKNYVTQARKGTYTTVHFDVPKDFEGNLVLNAGGYYNHVRDYKNKPNKKYLKDLKNTELSTHKMSRLLRMYALLESASKN
jgi:hypothetical protein